MNNSALVITDNAKKKIENLLAKSKSKCFFRIEVKGGGCSGFKYEFSVDDKNDQNDIFFETVIIDKASLEFIKGSTLDYSNELIGEAFKILNPQAKASCGCGNSFSV